MKLLSFAIILLCLSSYCMITEAYSQAEYEQYIWPIDDPNIYPGASGATGNNISGTIGEFRGDHFHAGVDMPYPVGTSVWFQEYLSGQWEVAEVQRHDDETLVTENKFTLNDGYEYTHVNDLGPQDRDLICDGPAWGITGRWFDQSSGYWYFPRQVRIGMTRSGNYGPHLHFEDKFGNPLDINVQGSNRGLNPYSDSQEPVITGIKVHPDGSNTPFNQGQGTLENPYLTYPETTLDLVVDLYDPTDYEYSGCTSDPHPRTMPYLIYWEAFDASTGFGIDYDRIEFEYYSEEDEQANAHENGVSDIYASGTKLGSCGDPTVYKVRITSNFSMQNGGSDDYIHFVGTGRYYVDIYVWDQSGNPAKQERVYFDTRNAVGVNGHTESLLPTEYQLKQNFPNPFNPSTAIRFALPKRSLVTLAVFNEQGGLVRELVTQKSFEPGWGELVWDGANVDGLPVASGAYFYRLTAESLDNEKMFSETKKLLLVR